MVRLIQGVRTGEYSSPKTVLGFYAGVLVILEAGVVAATGVLATQDSLHYLIPWILAFGAATLIVLIGIVVAMNVRDPTKLQLGQITGREYIEAQVTLGDSTAGEYLETFLVPGDPSMPPSTPHEVLPQKASDEESEKE
jgi:hypothetical protein